MQPLSGLLVLDFTTLLPGPLASLMLAEAGAEVIKIERPGGEDMRRFPPIVDGESSVFAMLNRGKEVLTLDLKAESERAKLVPLIKRADILIEQFRPGVMVRLGLGYDDVRKINPKLIYCSISGYGQSGPRVEEAGHDINYIGNTGVLDQQPGPAGAPVVPPMLVADIAGGSFPAVINILLALRARDREISQTGRARAGRRLAALPALSGQERQNCRLRGDRAEILAGLHESGRFTGGIGQRPARSEGDARCGRQVDRRAHLRRMAADLCRRRLLHDHRRAVGAGLAGSAFRPAQTICP